MSLALVYFNRDFALAMSDGRAVTTNNGEHLPVSNASRKVIRVAKDTILVSVGPRNLCLHLADQISKLAASPNMNDQVRFSVIAQAVPLIARTNGQFCNPENKLHLVELIAYDEQARSLRRVKYDSRQDYLPEEAAPDSCDISGWHTQEACDIFRQLEPQLPVRSLPNMARLFIDIIDQMAIQFPNEIGGNIYCETIFPPEVGEGGDDIADSATKIIPTKIRMDAATDADGNLKFKNVESVVGSTSSPSTNSVSFTDLADPQVTITTKGNKVLVLFNGEFHNDTAGQGGLFQMVRDSTLLAGVVGVIFSHEANRNDSVMMSYIDSPSAGSHTYKIQWETSGAGTLIANGTVRVMQVIELG